MCSLRLCGTAAAHVRSLGPKPQTARSLSTKSQTFRSKEAQQTETRSNQGPKPPQTLNPILVCCAQMPSGLG